MEEKLNFQDEIRNDATLNVTRISCGIGTTREITFCMYHDLRNCGLAYVLSLSMYRSRNDSKQLAYLFAKGIIKLNSMKHWHQWKMIYYNANHKQGDIFPILALVGFEPVHQWQNFVHEEVDIITLYAVTTVQLAKFVKQYERHETKAQKKAEKGAKKANE